MPKELAFYVSKELVPSGNTRFLLRSNQSSFVYRFEWGGKLPELKIEGSYYHESFSARIGDLLHSAEFKRPGKLDYKVFYNQEYKSSGVQVTIRGKDQGIYYGFSEQLDEVPLEKEEIFHFMRLFRDFTVKED